MNMRKHIFSSHFSSYVLILYVGGKPTTVEFRENLQRVGSKYVCTDESIAQALLNDNRLNYTYRYEMTTGGDPISPTKSATIVNADSVPKVKPPGITCDLTDWQEARTWIAKEFNIAIQSIKKTKEGVIEKANELNITLTKIE